MLLWPDRGRDALSADPGLGLTAAVSASDMQHVAVAAALAGVGAHCPCFSRNRVDWQVHDVLACSLTLQRPWHATACKMLCTMRWGDTGRGAAVYTPEAFDVAVHSVGIVEPWLPYDTA